jgi:hypothetical protein
MQSSDSAIGGETEQRQTIGHFRSLCAVGSVDKLDHLSDKSSSRLRSTEQARYGMIDRPEIATATPLIGRYMLIVPKTTSLSLGREPLLEQQMRPR